jgi:DNA-binding transcriptional MerR regulator
MTIQALIRASGISRSTLLYYESAGLLRPARRSAAGYRLYGPSELERVGRIRALRSAGLTLDDIGRLLEDSGAGAPGVLKRRLEAISGQIAELRGHQRAILRLLGSFTPQLERNDLMTKEKWVAIMDKAGFTQEDKQRWHKVFEASDPQEHELFLRYLQIPEEEIRQIREWSRK